MDASKKTYTAEQLIAEGGIQDNGGQIRIVHQFESGLYTQYFYSVGENQFQISHSK